MCDRVEIFAVSISSIHFPNKKTTLDYLYQFLSFSVHNFSTRTDGRKTFFENALFLLPDQEYIYMSIPSIFLIFQPLMTKVSIPLFSSGNGNTAAYQTVLVLYLFNEHMVIFGKIIYG